ncbi:MAG: DUF4266 domain-containing protein [Epsilonproteobacteria bacterium]|nr:DUF4266 domain-containing protein [Campylobacterota bacterium]
MRLMIQIGVLTLTSLLFMGCSVIKEVKPWEKETLAKPIMQFEGLHPEVRKFESHVYFSKEATRGGNGVSGGGCGCN